MRILLAQINPIVGDLKGNTRKILEGIARAQKASVDLIVFPECSITGYPMDDFLLQSSFILATEKHLEQIAAATKGLSLTAIVGLPRQNPFDQEKSLYNSAAVIQSGKILGFQDKMLLPTYDVFDERRYFEPGTEMKLWNIVNQKVAITICEDIWEHSEVLRYTSYHKDPILDLQKMHPDLIVNISASPYSFSKPTLRCSVCMNAAKAVSCPLVLCNQVGGNDSLIFDGYSVYVDGQGRVLAMARGFEEDFLLVDTKETQSEIVKMDEWQDLYRALVLGLRDYFRKSGFKKACLGLSGGIDSALVACIAAEALGKENVLGLALPSRFSSEGSVSDARKLAENLGISFKVISIEEPFKAYLELMTPHFEKKPFDVTEENMQARIRGMILMSISNKHGYIVLSPGNKSELALGYATLYGDMCGGLGVISDLTKGQVYTLARWINRHKEIIPQNTLDKPPSAELKPNQKDSDSLPDYAIVDNVLKGYVEEYLSPTEMANKWNYPLEMVTDLVNRIHRNEYKRRQSPPGLRVSEKAFTVGRRFPIVQRWQIKDK